MGRLDGRVAAVTGGASGIGRAMVLRFLDEGASVVAADRNEAAVAAIEAEIGAAGAGARFAAVPADVTVEADVAAVVRAAVERFGRLDAMCNNAGVGGAFGPVTDIDVDDWDATFAVLVRGVFLGVKHATRAMRATGGGAIVNTASVAGLAGGSAPLAYSAAKAAVINLTRASAAELASWRIRSNCICPGGINTPLIGLGRDRHEVGATLDAAQPWPDHGRPEDVAAAAAFLVSDDAAFVTGEALVVDGGLMARGPGLFEAFGAGLMASFAGMSHGSTGVDPVVRPVDR